MSEAALAERSGQSTLDRMTAVVTAGALSGFLAAFFSISDATFIFGLSLPNGLAAGIGIALLSTAILASVTAATSSIPGVVAQTQEVPLATLAVVAASIAAAVPPAAGLQATFSTLICTLGLSTLATGGLFFLLGHFRLGRFVRFVPLPTVAGFIAGMGWVLLHGSLEVTAGRSLTFEAAWGESDTLLKLLLAGLLVAALFAAGRGSRSALAMPGVIIGAVLLFHLTTLASGAGIAELEARGWFITVGTEGTLAQAVALFDFGLVAWGEVWSHTLTICTMAIISALALLMTAGGIELAIQRDVSADRELKAAGAANLCAGLAGGIPGFQAFGLTMLNRRLGAAHRATGFVVAGICLLVILFGGPLFEIVPLPVFGGLLLWLSLSLLQEWLVGTWRRVGRGEYLIVVAIVAVIATVGFLEGLMVGLLAGMALFVVDYSRVDIVNARLSGRYLRSSMELSRERQRLLTLHGETILILRLQGYIFFGTADRLRERIQGWLAEEGDTPTRYLLIDFRRATGIDSSAVLSFLKLAQYAEQKDFRLVLTGLSEPMRTAMRRGGIALDEDRRLRCYGSLDRGLRWCEKKLLQAVEAEEEFSAEPQERLFPLDEGEAPTRSLLTHMHRLELPAGHRLVTQGDNSHEMYFIESGQVGVHLMRNDGETVRLKTLSAGTTVGELAFYLDQKRSASVTCDQDSVLWRFGKDDLARLEREAPRLAAQFHQRMATLLSERLSAMNRLVQVLID